MVEGASDSPSREMPKEPADRRPHAVVVGAGFGGLAAVKALARLPLDVTVVDRRNHHLFQPLLYQVATAALSPEQIAAPIRAVVRRFPNVRVMMGEVTGVDTEARRIRTADGWETGYDFLILATGSHYSYFGHPDWAPHAPGLKSLDDAVLLRRRILRAFERAELCDDAARRRELLTFVVIGGGPTGVELAGALAELARATLARDFRHIDAQSPTILLVEAGPRLLAAMPEPLGRYAARVLEGLGVTVELDTKIERVEEGGVVANGAFVPAGAVIWCAGVAANRAAEWLGVAPAKDGAVEVAADLAVPGRDGVFVIGDGADLAGPDGRPLPKLAPVAEQQGSYVARLIGRRLAGRAPPGPFAYRDRGTLAAIGRSAAVADFGRFRMKGFLAWLIWGAVHIYGLIGFRNRLLVITNWFWEWVTYARGARLITGGDD